MKNQFKRKRIQIIVSLLSLIFLQKQLFADELVNSLLDSIKNFSQNIKEVKLSNGIPVIIYRRADVPIFSGVVAVKVGGIDETPGKTGLAHMLEHMAFKGTEELGTKNYAKEKILLERQEVLKQKEIASSLNESEKKELHELSQELETLVVPNAFGKEISIRGGQGLNANTTKEATRYFVSLPRNSFEYWCYIESMRILKPVMRQFYQERDVVLEERRMRYDNDPQGKLYEDLLFKAFTKHPYRNPVIGYEKDIRNLTATDVSNFHKKFYVAENISIAVTGDVSLDDISTLEKYFGKIPKGGADYKPRSFEPDPPQKHEEILNIKYSASPQVVVAYHKPNYPDQDDPAISLLEQILAGSKLSPLVDVLVQKRLLVQDISISEDPGVEYPNLFEFWITPNSKHTSKEVVAAFDQEVEKFIKRGCTQEELEVAKRSFAVAQLGELSSNMSLATNLVTDKLSFGDWRAMTKWLEDTIKVTTEDVNRVAEKYLEKNNRLVVYLGSK